MGLLGDYASSSGDEDEGDLKAAGSAPKASPAPAASGSASVKSSSAATKTGGRAESSESEEMNRALDEYILRQMCFKSEIVDEITKLHEDSAYAVLGVSSNASDAEIKRAYRLVAMQCHPDKGGDKEDFQALTNAYEKIMEQRKAAQNLERCRTKRDDSSDTDPGDVPRKGSRRKADASAPEDQAPDSSTPRSDGPEQTQKGEEHKGSEEQEEEATDEGEPTQDHNSVSQLLEKVRKASEEASRYAKTAAEFSHQAADAAETARQGREEGSQPALTKSIAHSAVVLTLTVVKAVRVVGYATLDVAAQCRAAAKRQEDGTVCSEKSSTAMTLGLEALNAALACAEVTEATAADLQGPLDPVEDLSAFDAAASDRFVSAAVKASLAAASASNSAMSAAIAAVEGSRACAEALAAKPDAEAAKAQSGAAEEDRAEEGEEEPAPDAADVDDEAELTATVEAPRPPESREEAAAKAKRRLVEQRATNHRVLQRLNNEILGHQHDVRDFLRHNRMLIPEVSDESKQRVAALLQAYSRESGKELQATLEHTRRRLGICKSDEVVQAVKSLPMLLPFFQSQGLAIPVSVKARIIKMAALHDLPLVMKVADKNIFSIARSFLPKVDAEGQKCLLEAQHHFQSELASNVAEEAALPGWREGRAQ